MGPSHCDGFMIFVCVWLEGELMGVSERRLARAGFKKTVEKKGEGVVDYSYHYFNFLHKEQSSLNRG